MLSKEYINAFIEHRRSKGNKNCVGPFLMLTNKLKLKIGRKPVVLKKSIFYKKLKIVKNIVLKVKNYKRIKNKYL